MKGLEELLVSIVDALPSAAGSAAEGTLLEVSSVELELPCESRISASGELLATLPRGRFATGFQIPHSRISARFTQGGDP